MRHLFKDRWNSVGWLAGSRKDRPSWLRWERVYGELGLSSWRSGSRREFRRCIDQRMGEVNIEKDTWGKIRRGWCFGSEKFVEKMKERVEAMKEERPRERDSWAGPAVEAMEEDLAVKKLKEGCRKLGYQELIEVKGMDRYLLARWARSHTQVRVKWLTQKLGLRSVGTMSYGIWLVSQQLETNPKLQKRWNILKS